MLDDQRYVFISYKSEEIDKAKEIQEYLEGNGCKCWRAPESLNDRGTQDYSSDIFDAIRRCSCLLFVLSNRALCSDWVRKEVKYALERCHKPIIPYVVDRIPSAKYETDELMISLTLQKQLLNENLSGDMSVILPYVQRLDSTEEVSGKAEAGKTERVRVNVSKMTKADLERLESEADFYIKRIDELSKVNFFTCGNDYPFGMMKREKEADVCVAAKRLITIVAAITDGAVDVDTKHGRTICDKLYRLTYQFGACFTEEVFTLVDQFVMRDDPAPWACFVAHVKYYTPVVCGVGSGETTYKMLAIAVRDSNNPYAAIRMGICFAFGIGCSVSGVGAKFWYEHAEKNGCAAVYRWLGQMYWEGVCEIKADVEKAKDYYKKGIAAKDFSCYAKLGWLLWGDDNRAAVVNLCKGCENGDEEALSYVVNYFDAIDEELIRQFNVSIDDMRWRALCVNAPEYRRLEAHDKMINYYSEEKYNSLNGVFDDLASGMSQRHAKCSELMGDLMLIDISRGSGDLDRSGSCSQEESTAAFNESLTFIRAELGKDDNDQARYILDAINECEIESQTDPGKMKLRMATLDWRYYFDRTDARPSVESPFWKALIDCHADDKVTHLFADLYYPSRLSTFNSLTPYTLLKAIQDYPARPGSDLERVQNLWRNLRKLDYELVDVEQIRKEHGVCLTTGAAGTDIDRIRRIAGIYRDLSRLIDEPNEYSQLAIDLDGIAKKMEVSLDGEDKSGELFNILRKGQALERTLKTNSRLARLALHFDGEEFRCSHPQLDIVLDCYRTAYIRGNNPQCAEKMAAVFFGNNGRFRANGANESVAYSIRDALFKAVDKQVIVAVPLFLEVALFGAKVGGASIEADFQAIVKAEPIIAAMMYDDVLDKDILVLKIKIACAMAKIFMDTTLYSSARCEQKWGMSILLDRAKSILWLNHAKQLLTKAGNDEAEPFLRKSFEKELDDEIKFLEKFLAGGMESKLGSFSANEYDSKSSIAIMCEKIEAEMKETKDKLTFFPHVLLEDKTADLAISTDVNALLLKMAIDEDVHNLVSDLLCLRATLMKMEPESKVAIGIVCRPEQYETIVESVCEDIEKNDLHVLKLGELKNDIIKVFVDFGDLIDAVEAAKRCRIAAENGDKRAQCEMGSRYKEGNGVEKDFVHAVEWYRKAAKQGLASAQFNLGLMYEDGQGVEKDDAEAVEWYRKAAEQGHARAQFNLGYAYKYGEGVAQDFEEAVKWYRKAAEQGDASAQFGLGLMYEDGQGVEKDDVKAAEWYRKAAEQGHVRAQVNLGYAYEYGEGVAQDVKEAIKWYRMAAEQGDKKAKQALGRLSKET